MKKISFIVTALSPSFGLHQLSILFRYDSHLLKGSAFFCFFQQFLINCLPDLQGQLIFTYRFQQVGVQILVGG